jgi:Winged helix DNA-binding domain
VSSPIADVRPMRVDNSDGAVPGLAGLVREPPQDGAVLDRRTLNRTLLARQLLLGRGRGTSLPLLEHLVGMQAQVPLDPYVGCWARLDNFDPEELAAALLERRAVRMTLFRATIHLVTRSDAQRLRPLMQDMLERLLASSPFARALTGVDLEPILAAGAASLAVKPQRLAELRDAFAERWPAHDADALAQAVRYLVPLVQVTPRGVWRQTLQTTFTTLERWLGPQTPEESPDERELVLRYFGAFGPASPTDLRVWSSLRNMKPAIERLRPELTSYRDERGRVLYDLPGGLFVDGSAPAPVRFLPQYDNLFLSHAERARTTETVRWDSSFAHHGAVFVDGFLAGAWKLQRTRGCSTLAVQRRTTITRPATRDVREEAERLLAFLAADAPSRKLTIA